MGLNGFNETIIPGAGGGGASCDNRLVPDGEVGVEYVERVAAAVGLRVWTRKHASQDEQLAPKHAAAVVGQRGNLPLSLGETREGKRGCVRGQGGRGVENQQEKPRMLGTSTMVHFQVCVSRM